MALFIHKSNTKCLTLAQNHTHKHTHFDIKITTILSYNLADCKVITTRTFPLGNFDRTTQGYWVHTISVNMGIKPTTLRSRQSSSDRHMIILH